MPESEDEERATEEDVVLSDGRLLLEEISDAAVGLD